PGERGARGDLPTGSAPWCLAGAEGFDRSGGEGVEIGGGLVAAELEEVEIEIGGEVFDLHRGEVDKDSYQRDSSGDGCGDLPRCRSGDEAGARWVEVQAEVVGSQVCGLDGVFG